MAERQSVSTAKQSVLGRGRTGSLENCAVAKRLSSSRHTESILSMSIFYRD